LAQNLERNKVSATEEVVVVADEACRSTYNAYVITPDSSCGIFISQAKPTIVPLWLPANNNSHWQQAVFWD
jgi:hypothetical protein